MGRVFLRARCEAPKAADVPGPRSTPSHVVHEVLRRVDFEQVGSLVTRVSNHGESFVAGALRWPREPRDARH